MVDSQFCLCQASGPSRKAFENIDPLIGRDFAEIMQTLWPESFSAEAVSRFRHTLETGEPFMAPSLTEQRRNLDRIESYDWSIERITLPDGQYGVVCYFQDVSERVLAQKLLRDGERRYRNLFNSMDQGYCIIEMIFDAEKNPIDFCFLEVNPTFARQTGVQDATGKCMRQISPEMEEYWFEIYGRVALSGEPTRFINQAKALDGRWFDVYAYRIGGNESRQVAMLFTDITKRKMAETALRESEERYRNLFNALDEGFCIIEVLFDEHQKPFDFRFIEVNPAFEKQSGMHDVVSKRMRDLIPDYEESTYAVYGKVALTGEQIRFTKEAKTLNSWYDIYAARIGRPEDRRVAVVFNNITARTRLHESLRLSEERFRDLFDWGPLARYTVDAAGIVKEFNQSAVDMWGRLPRQDNPEDRFCGPSSMFLPDGTFLPHDQSPVAKVLNGEIAFAHDVELIIEKPNGLKMTAVTNVMPLKNADGKITGAISCLYDMTERTALERKTREQAAALTDLDRRKDEFLAMLSHELRSPLAPISNAVQLLRMQKNEDPVQQQARNVIERQVGQLKHLVDDLLEVSRITSGRVQLRLERVDIGGIMRRAVETTRPLIAQRQHHLAVTLPPEPVWLHADAGRLEQVVVNLLTNSAKYTDEGGQIWLSAGRDGDVAQLKVRDTGLGIAPELLPHVFDLFTQAERSLDRSQGGLGIGLSLVQRLVGLHGGTVDVTSVLGQGSEFTVRLPIAHSAAQQPGKQELATPPQTDHHCRVLVVDDNVDAAQSMAELLKVSGHDVSLAYDGPSALEAATTLRPDVVLLDIGLPGLTGFEVARRIRLQPALAGMVLVALTGYGQEADRQRALESGFNHHVTKPANFDLFDEILAGIPEGGVFHASADPVVRYH